MLIGTIEAALDSPSLSRQKGQIKLILTSPPFPLVRKKKYGNETGASYLSWLTELAPRLSDLLAPNGSIVVEIGNAWEQGSPTMSTLPLEALLAFKKAAGLYLCQHLICHNPARLPSPAQWVTIDRIRLKDSFTHVWWMSRSEFPEADNRRVLLPYSETMRQLLKSKTYNSGRRPSGHIISKTGFLTNHGGSISSNVIDLTPNERNPPAILKFSGTSADPKYRDYCKRKGLEPHPARMQPELAAFFIQFLTNERDLIFDPFAGSNTTGSIAERMRRQWLAVEASAEYAEGSKGRFRKFNQRPKTTTPRKTSRHAKRHNS